MAALDADLQARGRAILEEAERAHRICILMLGRPYHLDRGMNHGVLEDFQALGYPVLTVRSLPKEPAWLRRFFGDLPSGEMLQVHDVWPEGNITSSAEKVWGAKFAARHPNVAVLDLSSFKCGHDAPTYGIVERIVNTAGASFSALHDIDANKPSGAMRIRVKTYGHTLRLRAERLEEQARLEAELARSLEARRRALAATVRPPAAPPARPAAPHPIQATVNLSDPSPEALRLAYPGPAQR
jgi:predicted nucleotide-binding protein (sugar kinase/HSP70/actin superfamily)